MPLYAESAFTGKGRPHMGREDWPLLVGPRKRVRGMVFDHCPRFDAGAKVFAPMIRFLTDAGETVEIVDAVYFSTERPPVGATVDVIYPEGAPGQGRIFRPLTRGVVYLAVLTTLLILIGRALNLLPEESGSC
jgi:hypothetical protein